MMREIGRFTGAFFKELSGVGVYQRHMGDKEYWSHVMSMSYKSPINVKNEGQKLRDSKKAAASMAVLHLIVPLLSNGDNPASVVFGGFTDLAKIAVSAEMFPHDLGHAALTFGIITAAEHLVASSVIAIRQGRK